MRARWGLALGTMLVAPLAHAGDDDDVRCTLTRNDLVITVGDETTAIELACESPYAVVRKGHYAFVACGIQGVVIYDLHRPLEPTFHGRFLYDHPCVDLNADGQCLPPRDPIVLLKPANSAVRSSGIALVAIGGAAVAIGATIALGQGFADIAGFKDCFVGCSGHGPPAAIGWAALSTSLAGAGLALTGIPIWFYGSRRYVTTYATFGGGGVRVAF